jgi:hypothetical protein
MSYESNIHNALAKCKTVQEVDQAAVGYLKNINYLSWGIKIPIIGVCGGLFAYDLMNGGNMDNGVNIPQSDKLAHFAKGMITSNIAGIIADAVPYSHPPQDTDDEIALRKRDIGVRAGVETGMVFAGAMMWETLQAWYPPLPGSVWSIWDILADMSGHAVNVAIDFLALSRMTPLYNEIIERKHQLGVPTSALPRKITVPYNIKNGKRIKQAFAEAANEYANRTDSVEDLVK